MKEAIVFFSVVCLIGVSAFAKENCVLLKGPLEESLPIQTECLLRNIEALKSELEKLNSDADLLQDEPESIATSKKLERIDDLNLKIDAFFKKTELVCPELETTDDSIIITEKKVKRSSKDCNTYARIAVDGVEGLLSSFRKLLEPPAPIAPERPRSWGKKQ